MQKTAEQIWGAYMQSTQQGNDDWMNLLDDNVVFTGPVAKMEGKDAYIKMTAEYFKMMKEYAIHNTVSQGNLLATEGQMTVGSPSGKDVTFKMAEIYEVENGKIKSVRLYYDAQEFRDAFGIS